MSPVTTDKIVYFSKDTLDTEALTLQGQCRQSCHKLIGSMSLNDSSHLIRYKFMFVCTPLESELHSKGSWMLTLASPMDLKQRCSGHLHAALTLASLCSN